MPCPNSPLARCDCAYPLFAGRLGQLPSARLWHWLAPWKIADPFLHSFRGAARIEVRGLRRCEPWPGIITRRGWLQLAEALDEAAGNSSVEWIYLEIYSVIQQVKGFGAAMRALRRARLAKRVTACITAAGGLAVPLAAACDLVAAAPAAPIGWLDWGAFDDSLAPAWHASRGMQTLLESRRVVRRFGDGVLPALRKGPVHGEQLEGRGVDWLFSGEGRHDGD